MPPERFVDHGERLEAFADTVLVRCPRCAGCATIVAQPTPEHRPLFWPRRLTCPHCALVQRWASGGVHIDGRPTDWYFHRPLWLQTRCGGTKTLWAFNAAHLDFIERYVRAEQRRRTPYVHDSAATRLPGWIKAAKRRDDVVHAIGRLKARLPAG